MTESRPPPVSNTPALPEAAGPLRLWGRLSSINVRKVLWTCAEIGLPHRREDWGTGFRPTSDPDFAALNPHHLVPVVVATPRTAVVEQSSDYLHATASGALFGFVDDLELYADTAHGLLQARSVSRLGDSDLGVNANRLAALRDQLKG